MVHTLPDYSTDYKLATVFANIDDAELAARLGCPSVFDRRGNVVWYDDFEHGILAMDLDGEENAVITTDHAFRGGNSIKLTTGGVALADDSIMKTINYPTTTRLGLECTFLMDHNDITLEFCIELYDGTNYYDCKVRWDGTNDDIDVYAHPDTWTEVTGSAKLDYAGYCWHTMKLVIDTGTKKYVRCIIGNTEYNLSAYDLNWEANADRPLLDIKIEITNETNNVRNLWVDNVILTQNE